MKYLRMNCILFQEGGGLTQNLHAALKGQVAVQGFEVVIDK